MPRKQLKYNKIFLFSVGLLVTFSPLYGAAEEIHHVLKEGETLYWVSRKYKVPIDALIRANALQDPSKVRSGTRLAIPDLYEIKKGDTLYGIAKRNDVTVDALLSMNGLKEDSVLKVGQFLYIPRKQESASGQTPPPPTEKKSEPVKPAPPAATTVRKAADAPQDFYWPHPGMKKVLDGKLEGVSFEGNPGDPVFSVASGKVVWVGPYRGFGRVVFVQSDQGYIFVYAGNEKILVTIGDIVKRGQKIGVLGIHPYEQRSNLYFIVYKDGKPIKPEDAPRI